MMIEPENKSLYVEGADAPRTSAIRTSDPPAPSYMREQGKIFLFGYGRILRGSVSLKGTGSFINARAYRPEQRTALMRSWRRPLFIWERQKRRSGSRKMTSLGQSKYECDQAAQEESWICGKRWQGCSQRLCCSGTSRGFRMEFAGRE